MEILKLNRQSFFQRISSRELNGFSVRKRSHYDEISTGYNESGALAVQHNGGGTPPIAISFGKTSKYSHMLALADEDGYLSLFDTRRQFPSSTSYQENSDKAKIFEWIAHHNSIFDICWIKEDTQILTASGDQTMKLWDVQKNKCVGVLMGHTGSIKSVSCHPTSPDIIVSGSRDGSFSIWDLRCNSKPKNRREESHICSTVVVKGAHVAPQAKRTRRGKAASMSITSVLYLKDQVSVATSGAVDGTVKFWDTRNLKSSVTQTCPHSVTTRELTQGKRFHGISSLSQDQNGVFLSASCMDNRIYLYNILQLEKGPLRSFSGCRIETFYIKSAISPDATHIVSGSSDGNAYVWQVNKGHEDPIALTSHDGEVTAVDWCQSEVGKLATASDDFTVRIWNGENSICSSRRSTSSIRRRVMAIPYEDCRKLVMSDSSPKRHLDCAVTADEGLPQINSTTPITIPKVSTPETLEKRMSMEIHACEISQKTPEATLRSPSSVLNPPSTVKRTIRDYFVAA